MVESPAEKQTIIIAVDIGVLSDLIGREMAAIQARREALMTKKELGEIDEKALNAELKQAIEKAQKTIEKRAMAM